MTDSAADPEVAVRPLVTPAERAGLGLLVGGLVALLCGGLWALLVMRFDVWLAFIAWGVGLVTALTVTAVGRATSRRIGAATAGLTLLGVLFSKVLVAQFGLAPAVAAELAKREDKMAELMAGVMLVKGELSPPAAEACRRLKMNDALPAAVRAEVEPKLRQLTPAQRRDLAVRGAAGIMRRMGLAGRLYIVCSRWDLLWLLLALTTAYQVGAGRDTT